VSRYPEASGTPAKLVLVFVGPAQEPMPTAFAVPGTGSGHCNLRHGSFRKTAFSLSRMFTVIFTYQNVRAEGGSHSLVTLCHSLSLSVTLAFQSLFNLSVPR
jgi:hypothetical protein